MHCDFHWATEKPPATLRKRTISLSLVQSSRESTVSARMMTDRLTDESIINGSYQYPSGISRVLLPFPFLNISSKCKIIVHPFNRTYSCSTLSSSTIFEAFEKRKGEGIFHCICRGQLPLFRCRLDRWNAAATLPVRVPTLLHSSFPL